MNSQCIRARYLLTSAMIGVFLCLISAIYAEGDFFQKGERLKEQGNLLDAESAYARALKQINYADRSQLTETDREHRVMLLSLVRYNRICRIESESPPEYPASV